MTFQYALKPAVSARPDSDTLVWLENRLKRIAIDDKMLIAEVSYIKHVREKLFLTNLSAFSQRREKVS